MNRLPRIRLKRQVLPVALGLAAWCCALPQSQAQAPAPRAVSTPFLHTQGDQVVDSSGRKVVLSGVNLGGWLVEEPWMQPFVTDPPAGAPGGAVPIVDHVSLWNTAKARFGSDGVRQLRTAFRSNWITAADFDRIKADGLNCVRLPFLASLLDEPDGLHWLDQAVAWAGQRGIYVVLDMHGAPGGQSDQAHTGQKGLDQFFSAPSNIALAAADWRKIAARYRSNPTVAGYDLLNEPTGMPNSDTLYLVQNRLYEAIRSVDMRHIVVIEDGYSGIQWMPFPAPAGWQNVVYSTHYYHFPSKTEADQRTAFDDYLSSILKERERRGIPYYVGEFGFEPAGTSAVLEDATREMSTNGVSWTMWTYKVMWSTGGQSFWALYCNAKPITLFNFYTDSKAHLLKRFADVRTENLSVNPNITEAFHPDAPKTASRQTATTR